MLDPNGNNRRNTGEGTWQLQTHGSGLVEQVLEYQLLGALTAELLRRGLRFEVLHGSFDLDGYDVVIEAGGIIRHIQLKSMVSGGKTRHVPVNTRLSPKPSGCVVWMTYDPAALTITGLRWFGGAPGERLPHVGERVARHSRANAQGVKAERKDIRLLAAGRFAPLPDTAALADRLFGPPGLAALRRHLLERSDRAIGWLGLVQSGNFAAIPTDLDWEQSLHLAMLIDGYELAAEFGLGDAFDFEGQQLEAAMQTGKWRGDAAELWIALFLEHRRWRFSEPHQPEGDMRRVLDTLVRQLRQALTEGSSQ